MSFRRIGEAVFYTAINLIFFGFSLNMFLQVSTAVTNYTKACYVWNMGTAPCPVGMKTGLAIRVGFFIIVGLASFFLGIYCSRRWVLTLQQKAQPPIGETFLATWSRMRYLLLNSLTSLRIPQPYGRNFIALVVSASSITGIVLSSSRGIIFRNSFAIAADSIFLLSAARLCYIHSVSLKPVKTFFEFVIRGVLSSLFMLLVYVWFADGNAGGWSPANNLGDKTFFIILTMLITSPFLFPVALLLGFTNEALLYLIKKDSRKD